MFNKTAPDKLGVLKAQQATGMAAWNCSHNPPARGGGNCVFIQKNAVAALQTRHNACTTAVQHRHDATPANASCLIRGALQTGMHVIWNCARAQFRPTRSACHSSGQDGGSRPNQAVAAPRFLRRMLHTAHVKHNLRSSACTQLKPQTRAQCPNQGRTPEA